MNQNQNKTPVLLLPAMTATRAARIEAANARHAITDHGGTWTAVPADRERKTPATVRPPIYRQTPGQLQQTADTAARIVLAARYNTSGLDLFRELSNAAGNDRIVNRFPALEDAAHEHRQQAARLRQAADNLRAYAKRKSTLYTEATAARAAAERLTAEADRHSARAAALDTVIHDTTASDRADIVQAAIIGAMTHDHAAAPDEAFRAMCRAAGKAIGQIASPSALQANRTKVTEITPEEAAAMIQRYGEGVKIPHPVRGCTSQCYDTIEQRTRGRGTDRKPIWCKVSHYLTVAPYISFEAITTADEDGNEDTRPEYLTNGGLNAVDNLGALEAVEELLKRANLTPREAAIVRRVADQTATKHAEQAAREYWDSRRPELEAMTNNGQRRQATRRAEETADNIRTAARWESALDRAEVYSKANRRKVKSRILEKLTAARTAPEPMTEAEQDERNRRRWESMQRNSRRGHAATQTAAPDIIGTICPEAYNAGNVLEFIPGKGWTYRPTKSARAAAAVIEGKTTEAAPVIKWTESGIAPEATNPGEDIRAAEVERREAYRATAPHAEPPALTPREAAHRARLEAADEDTRRRIAAFMATEAATLARAANAARVTTIDTQTARHEAAREHMAKADTRSPEAIAEAERMKAAAANMPRVRVGKPIGKIKS